MDNELVRFTRAFPTEDDLIRGIASLLRRRPGVSGVTITDGTHERGKDIVFQFSDVTGRPEAQACVVKNTKISGTVGANNSATTVIAQARQALTSPYHASDGTDQYISHVLVMTPFELPQSALYSIQGELRGQVSFCCGGELLRLFNEYWPDFLLDSGALGIYVTQLKANIDRDDPVAVLFNEHNLSALKKTYIEPRFHVSISGFSIQIQPPDVTEFSAEMSITKTRLFVSKLRTFSVISTIEHFWSTEKQEGRAEFRVAMARFHDGLHQKWSKAYRQYESATTAARGERLSRSYATVRIDWTQEELAELSNCLTICHAFNDYLRKRVEVVNRFAARAKLTDLHSPDYLAFCELRDIAGATRGIVIANEPKQQTEVSRLSWKELSRS